MYNQYKMTEEDLKIREENLAAREYYSKEGMQRLVKAIGAQAIRDYGKAKKIKSDFGKEAKMDGMNVQTLISSAEDWFKHPWFKASYGITDPKEAVSKAMEYYKIMEMLKEMEPEEREEFIKEKLGDKF